MNYEIMKESEKELHKEFLLFCDHVSDTWAFVLKCIKTKKTTSKELQTIMNMEEESNHFEAKIQDDAIWFISKNEPLANHLRYIIANINSVKDLERMADYAVSALRFFVNNEISNDIRNLIVDLLTNALKTMNKVFKAIRTMSAQEAYKLCENTHSSFKTEYNEMLKRLSGILSKNSAKNIEKLFHGAIIIIKHIERLIDHVANIVENFVFIKQSDFFFNKHSKQFDK